MITDYRGEDGIPLPIGVADWVLIVVLILVAGRLL